MGRTIGGEWSGVNGRGPQERGTPILKHASQWRLSFCVASGLGGRFPVGFLPAHNGNLKVSRVDVEFQLGARFGPEGEIPITGKDHQANLLSLANDLVIKIGRAHV